MAIVKSKAIATRRITFKRSKQQRPRQQQQINVSSGIQCSHGRSWVRDRVLGEGGFCSVFLAKRKEPSNKDPLFGDADGDGDSNIPTYMAVKSATMKEAKSLEFEKDIIMNLSDVSSNFVKCYGCEVTKTQEGEEIYNILMEYCSEGSLYDRIKESGTGLPEYQVKYFTRDIVTAISLIHIRGLVHCDIKPDNILIAPTEDGKRLMAKLADFGLARITSLEDDSKIVGIRGTHRYMSPELVCETKLEYPADIWALGCVVLEMLTGKPMWGFETRSIDDLMYKISHCRDVVELPDGLSEWAKDFLENCLVRDVDFRWTADELLDHPFLDIKE